MKMTLNLCADKRLSEKVARLVKANVNIKREMPISKASRVYSGTFSKLRYIFKAQVDFQNSGRFSNSSRFPNSGRFSNSSRSSKLR